MVARSVGLSWPLFPRLISLLLLTGLLVSVASSQSSGVDENASGRSVDRVRTHTDEIHVAIAQKLDSSERPIRVDVDLVLVPVIVVDTMNHIVTGLRKEDFAIYEDGKERTIRHFSSEDGPISLGLILDFSKSMSNKVETERAAVESFFNNANPEDEYFVVTVSHRPRLVADGTQSLHAIDSALGEITPEGSTALLDAIYLGAYQMSHARYPRHALLIISDGGDNNSRYRLRETRAMLQESDIEVYAIGLFDTALFKTYEEYMGKKWLGELTDVTGGRTLTIDNLARLPEAASLISWELRHQYVLGFKPANISEGSEKRRIKVRLTTDRKAPRLQPYYRREYSVAGR